MSPLSSRSRLFARRARVFATHVHHRSYPARQQHVLLARVFERAEAQKLVDDFDDWFVVPQSRSREVVVEVVETAVVAADAARRARRVVVAARAARRGARRRGVVVAVDDGRHRVRRSWGGRGRCFGCDGRVFGVYNTGFRCVLGRAFVLIRVIH